MKIVMPKAEILPRMDPVKKIELCARVAYKSEDKITEDSAVRFCRKLLELGHTSVFEHARVVVPTKTYASWRNRTNNCPYGLEDRIGYIIEREPYGRGWLYTHRKLNVRDVLALVGTLDVLKDFPEADDYMSVRFVCDRAIANELVRHRQMSFTQESTRYVCYDELTVVRPVPFNFASAEVEPHDGAGFNIWYRACEEAEKAYKALRADGHTPQEARSVLPMSTKTELIMTGMYNQWEDVFKLRLNKAAHPQMQYLMKLLVNLPEFPKGKIHVEDKTDD